MHDAIGYAGMLRGWASLWYTQAPWLLAMLAVLVGTIAMVEQLMIVRAERMRVKRLLIAVERAVPRP